MKAKLLVAILFLICGTPIFSISGRQIIKLVDRNKNYRTSRFFGKMVIHKYGKKIVKKFNGYGRKHGNKFFMRFTNPQDRGVKYLKLHKTLWIYLPDMDDIVRISGHMLRKGMMGSDISYEDLLNLDDFDKKYRAILKGSKNIRGRSCYDVVVIAKKEDVTYYKQRLLIDKTRFIPLELEMYARSGRLLKKMSYQNIRRINGFYSPMKIIVQDMRRRNSTTTIFYTTLIINRRISNRMFTRQALYR